MTLHEGRFLRITYEEENSLFCQYWIKSPTDTTELKEDLHIYIDLYKKIRPKYALWLQKNFELEINSENREWINRNLNAPREKYGNEKVAFVVSTDVLSHISIMKAYEKTEINSKHFATENEARKWLLGKEHKTATQGNTKILFDGADELGNLIFKVNTTSKNITSTIRFLNSFIEQDEIVRQYEKGFNSLTEREKEILSLFCKDNQLTEITEKLFISIHTTRTHWKSIKRKLNIKNNLEIVRISKILFNSEL